MITNLRSWIYLHHRSTSAYKKATYSPRSKKKIAEEENNEKQQEQQ